MLVTYRSPLSADATITFFLSEFSNLLEQIITDPKPIIIFGDFNLHVDLPNDEAALKFLDQLLKTFGLEQHVNVATHRCGHTLDFVTTRSYDDLVSNFNVTDPIIFDHLAAHCKIAFKKPSYKRK